MIHSQYVLNGGASNAEVDRLWRKEHGDPKRRSSRRNSGRRSAKEEEMEQTKGSGLRRAGTNASRRSSPGQGRIQYDHQNTEAVDRDGYGLPHFQHSTTRSNHG